VFWDWKTGRIKSRLAAHSKVVIAHEWLPHETVSVVVIRYARSAEHCCLVEGSDSFVGRFDQTMGEFWCRLAELRIADMYPGLILISKLLYC
jgi:hypothetical protein